MPRFQKSGIYATLGWDPLSSLVFLFSSLLSRSEDEWTRLLYRQLHRTLRTLELELGALTLISSLTIEP